MTCILLGKLKRNFILPWDACTPYSLMSAELQLWTERHCLSHRTYNLKWNSFSMIAWSIFTFRKLSSLLQSKSLATGFETEPPMPLHPSTQKVFLTCMFLLHEACFHLQKNKDSITCFDEKQKSKTFIKTETCSLTHLCFWILELIAKSARQRTYTSVFWLLGYDHFHLSLS